MVLRAFSMAVLSQAEGKRQHVHEKAAETCRDSPDPFTRFGSRDCCWLTLYVPCYRCSTRATYIKPFTASINTIHSSFYISLYLSYRISLSDSRHIFWACVKILLFTIWYMPLDLLFSRSYFACMIQESHRQDPEEFYVKQDRIGSSDCFHVIRFHYI